jgi:hypothetical protein
MRDSSVHDSVLIYTLLSRIVALGFILASAVLSLLEKPVLFVCVELHAFL